MAIDCLSAGILVADHLCEPIPRLPVAGELIQCDRLMLSIGGCASNVATDLARLGVRVGAAGCIGRDLFGQYIRQTLAAGGVDVEHLCELPGVDTSTTLIINVVNEDRRFIHCGAANWHFRAEHLPWEAAKAARVVYVGGYLLMKALDPHELADCFRRLRAAGVKTVLDVVLPGPGVFWPQLAPVLPHTDVFLPNTDEAATITGLAAPAEQALRFHEAGAGTVVITCGGQGSLLVSAGERLRAGVYPVAFRGGTGSGDAFVAGYISGLLRGESTEGCLRWGTAVGASCVRSISATDSVFTRSEAEAFLSRERLAVESW